MRKINPIILIVIILIGGFCAFKIMSILAVTFVLKTLMSAGN